MSTSANDVCKICWRNQCIDKLVCLEVNAFRTAINRIQVDIDLLARMIEVKQRKLREYGDKED